MGDGDIKTRAAVVSWRGREEAPGKGDSRSQTQKTQWWLVSRISWVALSPSQGREASGVTISLVPPPRMTGWRGRWCEPSRGLSSLSSPLARTWHRPVWIQYTRLYYMPTPDPCLGQCPPPDLLLAGHVECEPLIGWLSWPVQHKSARNVSVCIQ